ncbi:unnamed protein product [Brachionus calyciflorus]|uniref:Uncharacterized protein n=1 Tax=Brachionus calyciflorus TaxID=104777 RepID=A0A814Q0Q9_9BILA|nr:unnamed protein product [Brachionus calyciflorus]
MFLAISLNDYNNLVLTVDKLNSDLINCHNQINSKDQQINHLKVLCENNVRLIQLLYSEIEKQKNKTEINKFETKGFVSNLARKRKGYFELEGRQVINIKSELRVMIEKVNEICNKVDLQINRVEMSQLNSEISKNQIEILIQKHAPTRASIESVLYIKDRCRMSDAIFDKFMRFLSLDIPSVYYITKARKLINNQFQLKKIDNGYYIDPLIQIKSKLSFLIKNKRINETSILIKLSADGTNIGRSVKIINFCYSVINEGRSSAGVNGTYTLGIFQVEQENFERIKN